MNGLLLYSPAKARDYAAKYCAAGNDCPDGQFSGATGHVVNTDCTHFISHALKAGGVIVPGDGVARCQSGLCYRVVDLEKWFADGLAKFGNLKRIQWIEAKDGDFVFLEGFRWRDLEFGITHVMMVAGPVSQDGSMVFGHSNERCGNEKIDYNPDSTGRFYRIQSPNGKWASDDAAKRFALEFDGIDPVGLTEQRAVGGPAPKRDIAPVVQADGSVVISRKVDDEILKLDFPSPALRSAILSNSPPPSTLVLRSENGAIKATWTGLLVRKNPDGSFKEIVPSSQVPSKQFTFAKV